ncbi:MAG: phosphate acetyltransferase, partial [Hyphomicrobiales bacterium]|nr:phosphate acetyltransferase [Hyphomicrobiales bacterium]
MNPIERCFETARRRQARIVLPEGEDARILQAAAELVRRGLARPVLLGAPASVAAAARGANVALDGVEIAD